MISVAAMTTISSDVFLCLWVSYIDEINGLQHFAQKISTSSIAALYVCFENLKRVDGLCHFPTMRSLWTYAGATPVR